MACFELDWINYNGNDFSTWVYPGVGGPVVDIIPDSGFSFSNFVCTGLESSAIAVGPTIHELDVVGELEGTPPFELGLSLNIIISGSEPIPSIEWLDSVILITAHGDLIYDYSYVIEGVAHIYRVFAYSSEYPRVLEDVILSAAGDAEGNILDGTVTVTMFGCDGEGGGGEDPGGGGDCEASFRSIIWWPHLDMEQPGVDKQMESFDVVGHGGCTLEVGYNQRNVMTLTPGVYIDQDSLPGLPIPMPLSAPSFSYRLTYGGDGQSWEFNALVVNIT